jgi:protein tyrosine/serine phosphatase
LRKELVDSTSTTTMQAREFRDFQLEGAANFRDLGGYPTASGAMIRRGRIFRSDALHRLTASDISALGTCNIATLIDLRSEGEVTRSAPSPLLANGVRHCNIPIWDVDGPENEQTDARLAEQYVSMVAHCGPAFREMFRILANAATCPAVIHCAAGKDRTGIASALILGALGASDDTIATEYAITDANVARIIVLGGDAYYDPPDNPSPLMRAHPKTMTTMLESINETWGSIPGYLTSIGVTDAELASLSAAMLEDSPR